MKIYKLLLFLIVNALYAQPNCNLFLLKNDTLQYKACKLVENEQNKYYQFDKRFHKIMNEAIEICPYFAYPYREIAAPYVKSGNFLEWKKNIDKAVKYDRKGYLPVRASLRYKFFADYRGVIKDIDSLEHILPDNIGYSSNGVYHLKIVKGLCMRAMGNIDKAIAIIEEQSEIEGDFSMYNYIHLGVLYMEKGNYEKALWCFKRQQEHNNLAENQYYTALCYKFLNYLEKADKCLKEALKLYKSDMGMHDPYNELFDQIYLTGIENEMESLNENK